MVLTTVMMTMLIYAEHHHFVLVTMTTMMTGTIAMTVLMMKLEMMLRVKGRQL